MKIQLIGAGGHAAEVTAVIQSVTNDLQTAEVMLWAESGAPKLGIPGAYYVSKLDAHAPRHVAVGHNAHRRRLTMLYCADPCLPTVTVQASSAMDHASVLGDGSYLAEHCYVGPRAVVGRGVIINRGAMISHDCVVGDFAHLAPGANVGGHVTIGEGAFLGMGVVVVPGVKIGAWGYIDAGAVVTRDVPERTRVYGPTAVAARARGLLEEKGNWMPQRPLKEGEWPA